MSLKSADVANFNTLKRAVRNRDVALVQCSDAKTGEYVAVICAVQPDGNGGVEFVPLARMFDGNPYDSIIPPA